MDKQTQRGQANGQTNHLARLKKKTFILEHEFDLRNINTAIFTLKFTRNPILEVIFSPEINFSVQILQKLLRDSNLMLTFAV